jgi:hypothetical protein
MAIYMDILIICRQLSIEDGKRYQQVRQDSLCVDEEFILRELAEMRNTLDSGELRTRKLVLQKTVDKTEVGRDVARLHYKFPLSILLFKRVRGLEPLTSTLGRLRSTTELYPQFQKL